MFGDEKFLDVFKKELGKRFYRYIESMGKEGGIGKIFFIFSQADKEIRVVKLYKDPIDDFTKKIYIKDIQKLVGYEHEYFVKVFDKGFFDYDNKSFFFIIMEYIRGKSLEEIDSKLFFEKTYNERIDLFTQTLKAIDLIRKKYDFHNDLHQGNIMLTEENKIKLIDPGSSKFSYDSGEDDFDLYLIKKDLIHFFLKAEEIKKLEKKTDLNELNFNKFKVIIENEKRLKNNKPNGIIHSKKSTKKINKATEFKIELKQMENLFINYFMDEGNKSLTKLIRKHPEMNELKFYSLINTLNKYFESKTKKTDTNTLAKFNKDEEIFFESYYLKLENQKKLKEESLKYLKIIAYFKGLGDNKDKKRQAKYFFNEFLYFFLKRMFDIDAKKFSIFFDEFKNEFNKILDSYSSLILNYFHGLLSFLDGKILESRSYFYATLSHFTFYNIYILKLDNLGVNSFIFLIFNLVFNDERSIREDLRGKKSNLRDLITLKNLQSYESFCIDLIKFFIDFLKSVKIKKYMFTNEYEKLQEISLIYFNYHFVEKERILSKRFHRKRMLELRNWRKRKSEVDKKLTKL